MKAIGIRCTPAIVYYSIIERTDGPGSSMAVVDVDRIVIPKSLETPGSLKYLRNTLLDILREYGVTRAGIRVTEPNSQTLSIERLYSEGVILELLASSEVTAYYIGYISNISSRIGIDRAEFKKIVEGETAFSLVERFSDFSKEEREATLTAIGAFND